MDNINSKDIFQGETFLLKTVSQDGYSVIIGGICSNGKKEESILAYSQINKIKLGQSKDEFLVDYTLAKAITQLSPRWIIIVGASIYIHGVQKNTGGIIGNPFEEHESSNGGIEEVISGLFLISSPGGPGIAFRGNYENGRLLEKMVKDENTSQNIKIELILKKLDEITKLYILVADGSGKESFGGIFVCDSNGKTYERFC
ncbi:hypothetical protein GOM49_14070 [Clostridium bovifaecis]|uniref:Uncharacterized protein n=1 Tax=Clostridium bovifaecis TaxID=2184719 RepID=A0A6I6F6Y4_9CLOT|nr:hypothetical protein GOM49_14070 [Clostridium bovifaecis]